MSKPLLVLDFDGVIHSYPNGWTDVVTIDGPPVPGAIEFIIAALDHFRVAIFSSRSAEPETIGIAAMYEWLWPFVRATFDVDHSGEDYIEVNRKTEAIMNAIEWPTSKPPAFLTIDDRAVQFHGTFPPAETLLTFKTWQQK